MFSRGQILAALFSVCSIIVLSEPIFGPNRWIGLITFLFVGVPWYIIATKRSVQRRMKEEKELGRHAAIFSPTLFVVGVILTGLGLIVEYRLTAEVIDNFSVASIVLLMQRVLLGLPFLAVGVFVLHIATGQNKGD